MDTGIGRILARLRDLRLDEDTLVIFTSDNGNLMADQSQAPFRGGKATIWEGGLRVPFAIRWPGRIRAGTTSNEPVVTHDLFSTIMEVGGAPIVPRLHDGTSLMPVFTGGASSLARDALYWHYPHYHHLGDFRPGSVIAACRQAVWQWPRSRQARLMSRSRHQSGRPCTEDGNEAEESWPAERSTFSFLR